jgi:hypothetical protein
MPTVVLGSGHESRLEADLDAGREFETVAGRRTGMGLLLTSAGAREAVRSARTDAMPAYRRPGASCKSSNG